MDKSLYNIKELDLMYDTLENHLTDDYDKDLLSNIYEWHSSYETELDYENDKLKAEIELLKQIRKRG